MPKTSGLGQKFFVDGYAIAGDVQSFNAHGGHAVFDMTGIDKFAYERQGGRKDGGIEAITYYNPEDLDFATPLVDTGSHYLLRTIPLTDRVLTVFQGNTSDACSVVAKQGNYDPTLAADGSLTIALGVLANGYGLEWGDQLTAPATGGTVTHTEADETTSVDFAAATAFGAQAYLHVLDLVGDDVTVAIQSSSDNGAGDAFANVTGLVFTEVTAAPTSERIQTGRTASIERYLRVATTGTFTSVTIAVMVAKNATLVNF